MKSPASELIGMYLGHSSPKVDAKVAEAAGGVLFIDEIYMVTQHNKFGKEVLDCIMKHLEPPKCIFIFAGYKEEVNTILESNPGFRSRLPNMFIFEPYNDEQLADIFKMMCKVGGYALDNGIDVSPPI